MCCIRIGEAINRQEQDLTWVTISIDIYIRKKYREQDFLVYINIVTLVQSYICVLFLFLLNEPELGEARVLKIKMGKYNGVNVFLPKNIYVCVPHSRALPSFWLVGALSNILANKSIITSSKTFFQNRINQVSGFSKMTHHYNLYEIVI